LRHVKELHINLMPWETAMNTYPAAEPAPGGPLSWPRRAEAWLDARGRKAWIVAMVAGFILFWPVGLALVAYITFTNRWSKDMFGRSSSCSARRAGLYRHASAALRPSGNGAFDAYKAETLRRLEEEQEAFEAFLERLRAAKDKSEFDAFMDERARAARTAPPPAPEPELERPGAY
jgi:hypothetical protein